MRFTHRRYQDGDAVAINELYYRVTGRYRTIQEHAWQWLETPAGESEIWLIEAETADGKRELIGHHGVMAELFTYRGKTARVGKTENTMVLPEYRDKIIYPRYEKIFKDQYKNRFHALFSTTGPSSAIRLRKAMGYVFEHDWTKVLVGHEPYLSLNVALDRVFKNTVIHRQSLENIKPLKVNEVHVACIDQRRDDFDFDGLWAKAALNYGLTPARTRANLKWRFWSNPYIKYYTISLNCPIFGISIAVISFRSDYILHLDDLYCENPNDLSYFLSILSRWANDILKIKTIMSSTTSDCVCLFKNSNLKKTTFLNKILKGGGDIEKPKMPRLITEMGIDLGISKDDAWYVTPFYFEGRS